MQDNDIKIRDFLNENHINIEPFCKLQEICHKIIDSFNKLKEKYEIKLKNSVLEVQSLKEKITIFQKETANLQDNLQFSDKLFSELNEEQIRKYKINVFFYKFFIK